MSEQRVTVAFLDSADAESGALLSALQRFSHDVVAVSSVPELVALVEEDHHLFDAVIVPLRLLSGGSGVTAALLTRANETLTTIPIVALSNTRDIAVISALYGAGADAVLTSPFDAEAIVLQIAALGRQKRAFDEQLALSAQSSGLKRSVYEAFNAVREGVLVFSNDYSLTFLNEPARRLLGVDPQSPPRELTDLAEQFLTVVEKHTTSPNLDPVLPVERRLTIVRRDGRSIQLGLRIKTVIGADESPAGIAVALIDLTQFAHLANTIEQDHRTRSLALLTAAGVFKLLSDHGGRPHSIIPQIEESLSIAPRRCSLNATVTALLELIDPALNPGARVRVNIDTDAVIAVSAADLFQLAGHLVLHSVARSGVGGETTISASVIDGRMELQIVSELSAQVISNTGDLLSRLIHGSWSERATRRTIDGVPLADFDAAREIAQKNGLALKERPLDGSRVAYVLALPLVGVP